MQALSDQVAALSSTVKMKDEQLEKFQQAIENLQLTNESIQQQKNNLAKIYDSELKSQKAEMEKLRKKAEYQDEVMQQKVQIEIEKSKLEERLAQMGQKLETMSESKNDLQLKMDELTKKLKSDIINNQDMIDKKIISNFLVKYFDLRSDYTVKLQILETLSSVLNFTHEEKEKIGLQKAKLQIYQKKQQQEFQ